MTTPEIDLVRFLHLAFFAAGMGAGFYAETKVMGRLNRPITERCVRDAEHAHQFVAAALLALWATGGVLIFVRTGFDLAAFSPKLWTKLIVVSVLTVDAVLISLLAMPLYRRGEGRALMDLDLPHLMFFCLTGAVSLVSWLGGLALGSSVFLKTAGWDILAPLLIGVYGAALVLGPALAIALKTYHRRDARPYEGAFG